jgi:beta-glucanase (GH16 family)
MFSWRIWTKTHFQYGYFECWYRYGAAPGLNDSFWIMTRGVPIDGTSMDVDYVRVWRRKDTVARP